MRRQFRIRILPDSFSGDAKVFNALFEAEWRFPAEEQDTIDAAAERVAYYLAEEGFQMTYRVVGKEEVIA